jgi:glutaredoxin
MKHRIAVHIICAGAVLAAAAAAHAQSTVYRWVDRDGKVQFTDTPPPAHAKSVTEKRMGGGGEDAGQVPFATQIAARRHPVTLYVSDDCGDYCAQGRALLGKRGIPFSEKNPQRNPADAEALKQAIGVLEVPVLMVGANVVKGYGEESWQAALDQAGYARTRLPGQPATPTPPTPPTQPTPPAPRPADADAEQPK